MKVYIHVPFCHSKCAYCDFYSTPRSDMMEAYVSAVGREWQRLGASFAADTLYLGGGTPSSLPTELLDRLISCIPLAAELRECTVEANPEDVTPRWASHVMTATPVRRVSMGIQTFDDAILSMLGRRHTGAGAVEAYGILRRAGFRNLSCDLIYGLPGQSLDGWRSDVDRLIDMRPEHISAYLLSYEPRTRLGVMLAHGKVTEVSDTLATEMYSYLCEATRAAGYDHYEISNFALPGYRAIHNSSYWDGSDYLGLGPGAHSMAGGERWHNPSDLTLYCRHTSDIRVPDTEDALNRHNDMLITSLRTSDGLDPARIDAEILPRFLEAAAPLLERGLLRLTPAGRYVIPEHQWLIADSILVELIEV